MDPRDDNEAETLLKVVLLLVVLRLLDRVCYCRTQVMPRFR